MEMTKEMTEQIQAIIEKNLPAESTRILLERLKLARQAEVDLPHLRERIKLVEAERDELRAMVSTEEDLTRREKMLMTGLSELGKAERVFDEMKALEAMKLAHANERRTDTWRMMELLLANRVVRETAVKPVVVDGGTYDGNGCGATIQQETETRTTEEG